MKKKRSDKQRLDWILMRVIVSERGGVMLDELSWVPGGVDLNQRRHNLDAAMDAELGRKR